MLEKLKPIINAQPYPVISATLSGAHLYGFPSPDSDYDLRGIHLLPLREVAGLYDVTDTIEQSGEVDRIELDLVTHDAAKFFEMMLTRNGNVMEQVFSPLVVHATPAHEELKAIAPGCLTKHHAHHYLGFARKKWEAFQQETPHRVKPLLYVYRVLLAGIYLMETGTVESNLVTLNETYKLTYIPDLIAQKVSGVEQGVLPDADLDLHRREFERLMARLESAREKTHLPDNPTCKPALNDLLLRVRGVS